MSRAAQARGTNATLGSPCLDGTTALEEKDDQQDDEDQKKKTATDVHRSLLSTVTETSCTRPAAETNTPSTPQ
jgi:hypothetical protein